MTDALRELGWALAQPFADPASRTFAPSLLVAALIALALVGRAGLARLWSDLRHPSSRLDAQVLVFRQLLGVIGALPSAGATFAFAFVVVRALDRTAGVPEAPSVPPLALSIGYSLVLFVAWDLSRYALHRAMHEIGPLWQIHQVHHSAEVLTPLTFHRLHPLESLLYELRGVIVSGSLAGVAFWLFRGAAVEVTLLGVHALGLVLNAATGNLRHSHVWLSFGPAVERWLLSPAQHQVHHSADAADQQRNYGTWLAIWDRLAGTLRVAERPPAVYGLAAADRNHAPDDLVSALLGPLVAVLGPLRRRPAVAALLLLAGVARAEDEDDAYEVIVEAEDGTPRVAGSAHVIDEADLERFDYDDFQRVLGPVPGVYVRGEDGFGLRPNIGMRGANSDRSAKVTLLEDGVPLAPAPYAAPAAYYFPMPTRLAGVEVFKGPAATRHGPQTIGGAVNVLTRPVPTEADGALDLAYGGWNTVRGHAWAGTGDERGGVLVEVAHLSSDGFKHLPDGGPTGFERFDAMVKARLVTQRTADRTGAFDLKLGYGRERSNETYLGLATEDFAADPFQRYAASADDLMAWERGQAELGWTLRAPRFDVRAVAYYHRLDRAWTKLNRFAGGPDLHDLLQSPASGQAAVFLDVLRGQTDTSTPDQALMIGTNDRVFDSGGVQVVAHHASGGERVGHRLEVGLRAHADHVVRVHTEDAYAMRGGDLVALDGDTLTTLDSVTEARALAAHVHDDVRIGRIHLLPGVRTEIVRTAAGTRATGAKAPITRTIVLPGGAVLAQVNPWMDVFAGAHRGFSPVAPGSEADVRPETAWSYEAGLRAAPGESHAELVGFVSDYANIVGQCTLSGGCDASQLDQQFNGGEATVAGVEALAAHRMHLPDRHDLGAQVSYTLTHGTFRTSFRSGFPQFGAVEAGDSLPYVPGHQGALTVFHEHPRGGVAVALRGRGAMRDVAGQGPIPEEERIPAAAWVDVSGELRVHGALSAYANATNLVGGGVLESHRPYGARPSAPFQIVVGLQVR